MDPLESDAQRILACLGNPSRFRVVSTLMPGGFCVTDLASRVGLSQSCTTRHLQALQRMGLVRGQRAGKRVIFSLAADEPRIRSLIAWALVNAPSSQSGPAPARPSARDSEAVGNHQGHSEVSSNEPVGGARTPAVPDPEPASAIDPATPAHGSDLEDYLL